MADPRFFKKADPMTLAALADLAGAELQNPKKAGLMIDDVAPLEIATADHVSFLQNRKYISTVGETKAGACFVEEELVARLPKETTALVTDNPYRSFALAAQAYYTEQPIGVTDGEQRIHPSAKIHPSTQISATAVVGPNVEIGEGTIVSAGAVVDQGVIIGKNCEIGPNTTISYALIGDNVLIYSGAQIGHRGFGFAPNPDKPVKLPQLGRVIIEDHVEVGANTTIDRGSGHDTVIGRGTMIDNLVQVAHNVKIGRNCMIAAHVGISGSAELGDFVMVGGQAGFAGHIKVGSNVQVASKSGVMKDIDGNQAVGGFPAIPIKDWHRQTVSVKNLANKKKI